MVWRVFYFINTIMNYKRNLLYNTKVIINNKEFTCAICNSELDRRLGLSGQILKPFHGCILDFEKPSHVTLWMKDCLEPLTALFVDSNNKIVEIIQMPVKPENKLYKSQTIANKVIEIRPDDAKNIKVGDDIKYI